MIKETNHADTKLMKTENRAHFKPNSWNITPTVAIQGVYRRIKTAKEIAAAGVINLVNELTISEGGFSISNKLGKKIEIKAFTDSLIASKKFIICFSKSLMKFCNRFSDYLAF